MYDDTWTKVEKKAARRAFDLAYSRECAAIGAELRRRAAAIREPADLWALHDYFTGQRNDTDEKYDYRYSQLIFVFARLVAEGWLNIDELAGLGEEKLERIGTIVALAAE